MGGPKPQLSTWETITLIPAVLRAVAGLSFALITYPIVSNRPPGLMRAGVYGAVRQWYQQITLRQTQAVAPDSEEAYASAAKANKFATETLILEDGTKAHWIGKPTAKKVLLYFHGGGYVMFANTAHYSTLYTNVVAKSGSDTSILLLSYDLAPHAPYPRQLQQAALTLQHLLKTRSPSTILIGGDSAGGNLTAALLSHLAHPHPSSSIPKITLTDPLLGAVLISPWVGFDITHASYQQNQYLDLLPPATAKMWSNTFMGTAQPDNYNEPVRAPVSWWKGLPVEDVLITGGEEEVLIDEIREFAATFAKAHPATRVLIVKREAHDHLLGNAIMGVPPTESDAAVFSWIAAR